MTDEVHRTHNTHIVFSSTEFHIGGDVSLRLIPFEHVLTRFRSAAALAAVYAGAFSRPPWREDLRSQAFNALKLLAAEDDSLWIQAEISDGEVSSPVGAAIGMPLTAREDLPYVASGREAVIVLDELFVAEGFTDCGIGRRLLRAFEAAAAAAGYGHVVCTTHREVDAAPGRRLRDFYTGQGYRIEQEPITISKDTVPRILFAKHLSQGDPSNVE